MTQPRHVDDAVTVWHGDCLTVLAAMPDNSVDAVVTDPPYGLEFMGKDWDSFRYSNTGPQNVAFKDLGKLPTYGPNRRNQKCPACGKWAYDHKGRKCECGGWKQPAQLGYSRAFQQWCQLWATECLRVLKPGGHLLAFGGTRTHHRLASGIEDAGFEIRDSIVWLYGSGFPKSLDIGKAIDRAAGAERETVGRKGGRYASGFTPRSLATTPGGFYRWGDEHFTWEDLPENAQAYFRSVMEHKGDVTTPATDDAKKWQGWGTALKPGHEPIVVARKPLSEGSVAGNVLRWGAGGLNIDGGRVPHADAADLASHQKMVEAIKARGGSMANSWKNSSDLSGASDVNTAGRWPPNVALDPAAADQLDQQSGNRPGGKFPAKLTGRSMFGLDGYEQQPRDMDDEGGASRYFPVFKYEAKAPTHERPRVAGGTNPYGSAIGMRRCALCGKQAVNVRPSSQCQCDEPEWVLAESSQATSHPTVKPLDLMRWLIRLVTPPGGTVLDPFAGSGTTGEAAIIEGFKAVLIEREPCGQCGGHGCPDYLAMIMQRIRKPIQPVLDFGG